MRRQTNAPGQSGEDTEDLRHWLALHRTPRIGARRFLKLTGLCGTPADVFRSPPERLRAAGLPTESIASLQDPDWAAVDRDLEWLAEPGNHLIRYADPAYPAILQQIADPPALLFVHGNPDCLSQPQLAIVGSRNPSHTGRSLARDFAAYLASCGLTITSGLASGIDGAAHTGAIEADGATVAVTGTGLDRVYPARHRELAHRIAEQGALASEFPPGTAPLPANFPCRNRIISGLSLGTLIVEAALHSGSLITARSALEQGREVFAIPGSIHNPLARGCHALIREGAKLVETGEHILEELAPQLSAYLLRRKPDLEPDDLPEHATETGELSPEYTQLLDCIGYDPVFVDQLVERSGLTPEEVSSMLLVLELDGHLVSGAGGSYSRVR
ncbi:MAG: DNA-processing protein DprA [Gammaproteobacteria bacterium]|jgi:DNA processing protein